MLYTTPQRLAITILSTPFVLYPKPSTHSKNKCLRSDNGGYFTSKEFMGYCSNHGIRRQFFVARTPQHNGVVERNNRTVHEMARTMLVDSKLTDIFWTQAVHTIIHIQNRVMLRNKTDKTS
jgi:transposase InsO family protein